MLKKYSFIDETKVAASGVSYGGYAVGMMLAKSGEESNSMIRCGIAVSPVVEWRYYGTYSVLNHEASIVFLLHSYRNT